jgi:hypothetical protein
MLRRVVGLQDPRLRLVGLGEGIAALFAHALDLTDFANGFLELFHSVCFDSAVSTGSQGGEKGTE